MQVESAIPGHGISHVSHLHLRGESETICACTNFNSILKRIRQLTPFKKTYSCLDRRAPLEKSGGQVLFLLRGGPDGMHEGGGVFVYRKVEAQAVMGAR